MGSINAMFIAALSFSFCPLLYAMNLADVSPMTQALYVQLGITSVASIALIMIRRNARDLIGSTAELLQLPWHTWIVIALSGIAGYMGTLFFLWALLFMSEAGAAIIMESWPILAVFMAPALIKHHQNTIRFRDILLMLFILCGVLMISASEANMSFTQFFNNPFFMFEDRNYEEYIGIICAFLSALCYAWAGISRPYFSSLLPLEYRKKHFAKGAPFFETLYSFWLTCLSATPVAIIANLLMGDPIIAPLNNIGLSLLLGICLTVMGCMYAYSLMVSKTSMINLLWYIAPVLATLWLVLFGYSQVTLLLLCGGGIILVANGLLIITNQSYQSKSGSQ